MVVQSISAAKTAPMKQRQDPAAGEPSKGASPPPPALTQAPAAPAMPLLNVAGPLSNIRVGQSLELRVAGNYALALAKDGAASLPAALCMPSQALNVTFLVPTPMVAPQPQPRAPAQPAQPAQTTQPVASAPAPAPAPAPQGGAARRKRQQAPGADPKSKRRLVTGADASPGSPGSGGEAAGDGEEAADVDGLGDEPPTAYYCPGCSQWLYNRQEYDRHACADDAGDVTPAPRSPSPPLAAQTARRERKLARPLLACPGKPADAGGDSSASSTPPELGGPGFDPYTNMPRLKPAPSLATTASDFSPPTPSSPGQAARTSNSPGAEPVVNGTTTASPAALPAPGDDRSASNSPFSALDTSSPSARGSPNGRQYPCNICSKSFGYKGTLEQHYRTHTDARPFQCETCGKAFRQKTHLTRHILIHSGERPYKCSECGKQFNQSNNLNQHMITHSGKKDFECPVCYKSFTLAGNRKKHIQRKHPVFYQQQQSLQKEEEEEEASLQLKVNASDAQGKMTSPAIASSPAVVITAAAAAGGGGGDASSQTPAANQEDDDEEDEEDEEEEEEEEKGAITIPAV